MKLSTYIICLNGQFRAIGMDLLCETITDLDTGVTRSGIRTVTDRNAAILALSRPLSWREAYNLAARSGRYIGQLFPYNACIYQDTAQ